MIDTLVAIVDYDWSAAWTYITNGKHLNWYASVRWTIGAALFGGLCAVFFGLLGALLKHSERPIPRFIGIFYTAMVRGVPDVLFLIFFPLAFEIGVESVLAQIACSATERAADTWPPCAAASWAISELGYFTMACLSLGLVYGAFTANVLYGAMQAVPQGSLEAARALGLGKWSVLRHIHLPQMWLYALPGLSNVWMLLLKATSLLSLLQIADIVQWAERLGAPNYFAFAGLIHGDWRWRYYLVLFVFYILLTLLSEKGFAFLQAKASRGMECNR